MYSLEELIEDGKVCSGELPESFVPDYDKLKGKDPYPGRSVEIDWGDGIEDMGFITVLPYTPRYEWDLKAIVMVPSPWGDKEEAEPIWINLGRLLSLPTVVSVTIEE